MRRVAQVMHVLVDSASWLTRTVVALVRLREPIATELEEKRATRHTRFVVLVLGPRHEHAKRVQIGVALGALLQDDSIVRTAYAASSAADLFAAFDARLEDLHVMPQTARPTGAGVRKRLNALSKSLSEAHDVKYAPTEPSRLAARSNLTVNTLGAGRPTQQSKWNRRARAKNLEAGSDDMPHKDCLPSQVDVTAAHVLPRALLQIGASVTKIIAVAQQYALPLVLGIVVALFAANFDAKRYDRWAGSWHPPPTAHWGYGTDDGPRFWASLAREGWLLPPVGAVAKGGEWDVCHFGKEQSPINIPWRASGLDRAQTTSTHHRLLHRLVRPSDDTTFAVQQAHGAPVFMCGDGLGDCGTLVLDNVTYNLAQFHFHTPSENTVDGAQAPMTVHMVHCTGGCALGVDSFAVVTLLFEGGEPEASSTPKTKIIDALWPHLDDRGTMGDGSGARVERRPVNAIGVRVPAPGWFGEAMPDPDAGVSAVGAPTDPLSLAGLFSESSGYVTWKGSLTTPPCTEGLTWLLQAEPVQIHQSQIDAFWKHIGWFKQSPLGNARPAQPLYEREVTFFVDDDATGASATSVGAQTVEPEPSATVPNPCGLKRPGGVPPHGCGHHHDRPSIFGLRIGPAGRPFGKHLFTLNFLVNDILMVFFFGLAAKEIAEVRKSVDHSS